MKRAENKSQGRGARRSVSLLSLATLAGQMTVFLSLPVITRLYGPTTYGHYQTIYAAVTILGVVAALRLERAIPIAEDETKARAVAAAAYGTATLTMGTLLLLALAAPSFLADLLGNPKIASSLWVVPLGGLLTSGYLIATQWAIRVERHHPIAIRNAAQPTLTALVQVVAGFLSASLSSLNAGLLVGRLVGAVAVVKELAAPTQQRVSLRVVQRQAVKYRKFIYASAPSALLNSAALQLPILMIGAFFGTSHAGYYGVSAMLTVAPVTLLASAMSQVMLGEVAARLRNGRGGVEALLRKNVLAMLAISTLAALVILLASPHLGALLGSDWSGARPYLSALCIVLVMRLPASAVSPAISAFEWHGSQLFVDALRVAAVVVVIAATSAAGWTPAAAVFVMSVIVAATYALAIVLTLAGARRHDASCPATT